jgi:dipeptidyl aminopeptidase/acylaminoacyl peptidase
MAAMTRPITPTDLWKLARVGRPAPMPGGGAVVVGVKRFDIDKNEGHERLWLVPVAGAARPLTAPDVSSGQPAVSPDGRALAFVRRPPGRDAEQLHILPLDGGEARAVTDLPLGVADPRWFPDGKTVAVLAPVLREAPTSDGTRKLKEERAKKPGRPHISEDRIYRFWDRWLTDGEVHHIFAVDVETGAARDLTPDWTGHWDLMEPEGSYDIAPDGSEIAFSADVSRPPHQEMRHAIFVVPTAGGPVRCLTPDAPADSVRPRYGTGGGAIFHGQKLDATNLSDRVRLARIDRASGARAILTEGWDRSLSAWEAIDAETLLVEVDEEARTALYRVGVDGAVRERVARGGGLHGALPARDGHAYLQASSLARPPELARVPLGGGAVEVFGHFNDDLLGELALASGEEIVFEGAGGAPVQMWVLRPPGAGASQRPLVQVLHGGPYGAHHDDWHFRWNQQVFAAMGYVCAFVNFHGSSGFGHAFAESILGDWGGAAAQDILRATDLLVARGIADPERLALAGGSFGGYMAAWLPALTGRFRCAIAHAACFNLNSLVASDVTQAYDRELGGAPWQLPAARDVVGRWDPSAHTERLTTPTLVIHGSKDYRVPVEQGMALYATLQARGVPARLVVYPEENHWIMKPQSSLGWYAEVAAWLARWLG